jgi:hypothetical protein
MQKIMDWLWSRITESYEAQARVWDKRTDLWQLWASMSSACMHIQEQKVHAFECEISKLGNPQIDTIRQEYNEKRIHQLEIELHSARLYRDENQLLMLECEVEARRSQKKALEIRNKASAIQKMPNLCLLQLKQLYYETQACKCDKKAFLCETRANESRHGIQMVEAEVRTSDYSTARKCLEDPQPAPFWQEIVNPLRGDILAGLESPSEWADRKRERDNRHIIPGYVDELCECETQARHWREKADQFRNKASALISEPTSDIELSERSVLLDSDKCSNYQAIEPSTI